MFIIIIIIIIIIIWYYLTLNISCISESFIEMKTKLNFYFHTFIFKGLWGTTKKYEIKI